MAPVFDRRLPTSARRGLALAGLIALALAARLPNLQLVPRFTDESLEVLWSLPIARGQSFPLTNYDAYYGALFNYLVAGAFLLLGPSALAARLVVLTTALLTVPAAYALGRAWSNPLGGLLAAALLAANAAHIAINSHVAWANCTTPLFTTLAIWTLWRATEGKTEGGRRQTVGDGGRESGRDGRGESEGGRRRDPLSGLRTQDSGLPPELRTQDSGLVPGLALVLSGLLWGLALQTHLAVATLVPGAAVYLLWKGRRLLRTPWPWLAGAAFLLGYGNVLVFNLTHGWESLTSAQRIRQDYAADQDAATTYPGALGAALLLLARVLGSAVDGREGPAGYLIDPVVLVGVGLALWGLADQARRGNPLPLLLTISCLVLLPAANPKFRTLITSRYLMPLVPVLLAAVGALLAGWLRPGGSRWRRPAAAACLVLLLLGPWPALQRYYERAFAAGDTNERIYGLAEQVARSRRAEEPLILDESFGIETGGISEQRGLRYLLSLADVQTRVLKLTAKRLEDELDATPGGSLLVALNGRQAREFERLPLELLAGNPERGADVGLYRLAARGRSSGRA